MNASSIARRSKGRKLARERQKLGLTQIQFARFAHISVKTIWHIEQGLPCRMQTKRQILRKLRIDFSEKAKFFVASPSNRILRRTR